MCTLWQKLFNSPKKIKWLVPRIHPTVDDRIVHRVAHSHPVNDVINILHVFPVVDLRFGSSQHKVEMIRQPAHSKRDHDYYHHLDYLLGVKPIHSLHITVVSFILVSIYFRGFIDSLFKWYVNLWPVFLSMNVLLDIQVALCTMYMNFDDQQQNPRKIGIQRINYNSLSNMFRDIIIFYHMIYRVFYPLNIIFFPDFRKKNLLSVTLLYHYSPKHIACFNL